MGTGRAPRSRQIDTTAGEPVWSGLSSVTAGNVVTRKQSPYCGASKPPSVGASVVNAWPGMHSSSVVARNAAGESVENQTRDILNSIDDLLTRAGSDKTKMLSATIWLSDISTFNEMNSVWDAWVPEGHAPCRACVEAKLAAPEFTVEIMVTAARD